MGCNSSTAVECQTSASQEPCRSVSRIDSTTTVPDDIFFAFLRQGKVARNSGSHMEVLDMDGNRSLRRTDLYETETSEDRRTRRANVKALRPRACFPHQLPAEVEKSKADDEASVDSLAQTDAGESEDDGDFSQSVASAEGLSLGDVSAVICEDSDEASDDELSRQASLSELSLSEVQAALRAVGVEATVCTFDVAL